MDRLDAMRLFVRVVESGSFAAAAREAGVGQPAVSKQIAALEAYLGAQLIRRTSRSMTLTEAGQTFHESAARLVGEFETAQSLVGRRQSAPSGLVRVTAAPMFGRLYVVPRLPAFFECYPDISLEFSASERSVNLVEEGFDLAIHHGDMADSTMIARKIGATPFMTVATPAYLTTHGAPSTPGDLARHACVIFAPLREVRPWVFKGEPAPIVHQPRGCFRSSDAEQIRAAVLAGLGLTHGPRWLFAPEIRSGAVEVVLADHAVGSAAINAIHPAGRRVATKVQVLIDFLAHAFAADEHLAVR